MKKTASFSFHNQMSPYGVEERNLNVCSVPACCWWLKSWVEMKSPGDTRNYYLKRNSKGKENTEFREHRKTRSLQK